MLCTKSRLGGDWLNLLNSDLAHTKKGFQNIFNSLFRLESQHISGSCHIRKVGYWPISWPLICVEETKIPLMQYVLKLRFTCSIVWLLKWDLSARLKMFVLISILFPINQHSRVFCTENQTLTEQRTIPRKILIDKTQDWLWSFINQEFWAHWNILKWCLVC